ncbi:MAG: hypothetical protein K2O12_06495 [Muribaculaceae bacterium]|nr:hypothetical protein [Muribaculaceae bacterium]
MNRYNFYVLIIFLLSDAIAAMAAVSSDTIVELSSPSGITIDGDPQPVQRVRVGADRTSYGLSHGANGSWDVVVRGFMFGFVDGAGAPPSVDIEMGRSFEFAGLQLLGVRYSTPSQNTMISAGIGIDWRNYKMTGADVRFIPDGDGHLTTGPYPEGVNARFSRLKVFSLGFPFLIEQKFPFRVPGNARFSITAGVVLNYNAHASSKTEWVDTESNRVDEYCGSIGHRRFTVDFIGIVRFCKFAGLYVKYSPQTVLCGSINPRFRSLSTGIICFY